MLFTMLIQHCQWVRRVNVGQVMRVLHQMKPYWQPVVFDGGVLVFGGHFGYWLWRSGGYWFQVPAASARCLWAAPWL
jgi:hypothetical protein